VKLLFDENLSPRLVALVADECPGSIHVRDVGLARADDAAVWEYASAPGMVIVSKDSDFHQRNLLFGPPPRVVWIQLGNCTTRDVERVLRRHLDDIASLEQSPTAAFLVIE
jgi:predicted nuclease of predicted toxin-antitoxin system